MNTKGQSLIELAMVLPLTIALGAAILWFAQVIGISIQLMHTARHGVFWLAYHDADPHRSAEIRRVESECRGFLRRRAPGVEINRVRITVQPGDPWQPMGPKNLTDIQGLIKLIPQLGKLLSDTHREFRPRPASVTVEYSLASPSLLRSIPGFPQSIPLRGHSVCYR